MACLWGWQLRQLSRSGLPHLLHCSRISEVLIIAHQLTTILCEHDVYKNSSFQCKPSRFAQITLYHPHIIMYWQHNKEWFFKRSGSSTEALEWKGKWSRCATNIFIEFSFQLWAEMKMPFQLYAEMKTPFQLAISISAGWRARRWAGVRAGARGQPYRLGRLD